MGFCECGCGGKTFVAIRNVHSIGQIKGQSMRFIRGHNSSIPAEIDPYIINENGCWVWTQSLNFGGYGNCLINGENGLAHRLYYQKFKGAIPEGLVIDHLCSNRACVNPDHLEAVTDRENRRRAGTVKLTELQVSAIKEELFSTGAVYGRYTRIARAYGVHRMTITDIAKGLTFKEVKRANL